jgi:hypothetical protein
MWQHVDTCCGNEIECRRFEMEAVGPWADAPLLEAITQSLCCLQGLAAHVPSELRPAGKIAVQELDFPDEEGRVSEDLVLDRRDHVRSHRAFRKHPQDFLCYVGVKLRVPEATRRGAGLGAVAGGLPGGAFERSEGGRLLEDPQFLESFC